MASPAIDSRCLICSALIDSKSAIRRGITEVRYASSLEKEGEALASDLAPGFPITGNELKWWRD